MHLSNDLMLVGKVSAAAKSNVIAYKNASSLKKFEQSLADGNVSIVLVDLQFKTLDIEQVAQQVRSSDPEIKLCGYAQHVMTDLIEAAQQADFDQVLTRGQFDRGFLELMN